MTKNVVGCVLAALLFLGLALVVSPTAQAATNLISNPSMETTTNSQPLGWQKGQWGNLKAVFSYPSVGYDGSRSLKVRIKQYTSGDAKWSHNQVVVSPNTKYLFSDYYRSNIESEIVAEYEDNSGNLSYQWLGNLGKSQSIWKKAELSFTTPVNTKKVRIYHLIAAVGWLQIDTAKLVQDSPTTPPPSSSTFQRGLVSISFDDADKTIYQNGLPILNRYNIKSTQYVLTGWLDGYYYMTPEMVRAFSSSGHQLASHTVTHRDLTTLAMSDLVNELVSSKDYIISHFGVVPLDIASPYGAYNDVVINQIKNYYRSHRSVDDGFNQKIGFDQYRLKVQNITPNVTAQQIQNWLNSAKNDKSWLILVYHQIDNSGTDWSASPSQLESHLQTIQASGLTTLTVDQALGELLPQLQ